MSDNDKYHQLYDRLLEEVGFLHQRIKVGIRQGLKMLVIVPLLFMVLMFLTNGSKGIFLIFLILSTFVIAAFLIALFGLLSYLKDTVKREDDIEEKLDARKR